MRKSMRCAVARALAAAWCGVALGQAWGGEIDPPPGPIGATMRTLEEVEPRIPVGDATTPGDAISTYVISAGGAYYLTEDLIQAPNKDGIRIDAAGVTLDLRGFTVRGVSGDGFGITAGGTARDLHIRDGVVETFDQDGVRLHFVFGCVFENLRVRGNGGEGLWVGGESTLRSCVASENAQNGIVSNGIVVLEGCTATSNGAESCASVANTGDGFRVGVGAMSDCLAHGNSGNGYVVGETGSVTLANCSARLNSIGFAAIGESTFSACGAFQSLSDGFVLSAACTLEACDADLNGDDGFQLATGSVAFRCRSEKNGYGFYVPPAESMVRVDSCAAIWCTNTGFLMSGDLCLVVRNFARGNGTDFNFAGASQYGPIESASGTIATTSPWANFGSVGAARLGAGEKAAGDETGHAGARPDSAQDRRGLAPE